MLGVSCDVLVSGVFRWRLGVRPSGVGQAESTVLSLSVSRFLPSSGLTWPPDGGVSW